jgi:hypothetical protein
MVKDFSSLYFQSVEGYTYVKAPDVGFIMEKIK